MVICTIDENYHAVKMGGREAVDWHPLAVDGVGEKDSKREPISSHRLLALFFFSASDATECPPASLSLGQSRNTN